jgi:hypothetical protein
MKKVTFSFRGLSRAYALALFGGTAAAMFLPGGNLFGAVSYGGGTYSQDFNTLASSETSSTMPAGWEFSESDINANGIYTAGTGSSNAGDTYSFGATASTERALGGLLSANLIPTFGVSLVNNSGSAIAAFTMTFFGEQWRLGTSGRADRLDFQYSTDATSLTTGTWQNSDIFDFVAPTTAGTVGALNGNATANRTQITDTLGGLSLGNGSTIWFRWSDFNASGADDGLAIDDFSITAVPEPAEWGLMSAIGLLGIAGFHSWQQTRRGKLASGVDR